MMNNCCGGMEQAMETDEFNNCIFFCLLNHRNKKIYGASLGIFSAVNSLGQVVGVVLGGIIMLLFDHLAYWIIAAILLVVTY